MRTRVLIAGAAVVLAAGIYLSIVRLPHLAEATLRLAVTLSAGAMDAYWKPMYVFDLFCTTFCLASILLYAHGRWILSFIAFWLAYKSKELAVMLPVATSPASVLALGRHARASFLAMSSVVSWLGSS